MIPALDVTLRRVLATAFAPAATADQAKAWIRFQAPDDKWRQYVTGIGVPALNVYLVDLRENRSLRSNERVRTPTAHGAVDSPAARRVTCHYLVSAWNPTDAVQNFDVTSEVEHALLYRAAAVLMNAEPLVPAEVFAPDPAPFPAKVAGLELPMSVLPVDGFPKYAEFWGTMPGSHPWRPAVYLTVTIPVLLAEHFAGPMVTSLSTTYEQFDIPETAHTWVQIGGEFRSAAGVRLAAARVVVESGGVAAAATVTDGAGRFAFTRLAAGPYTLRGYAVGLPAARRDITVPSPDGSYDLTTS